jgi:hypothetical protein
MHTSDELTAPSRASRVARTRGILPLMAAREAVLNAVAHSGYAGCYAWIRR